MPAREAAELLAPVCRAIHYAHQQGVLHRDLKPSNILIDSEGRPLRQRLRPGQADRRRRQPDPDRRDPRHAQLHDPRAGRAAGDGPSRSGDATSIAWARSSTRCSPAARRSRPPSPLDTILLVLEQDPVPPRVLNPKADPDLEMVALKCLQKAARPALPDAPPRWPTTSTPTSRASRSRPARRASGALAARLLGETHHAAGPGELGRALDLPQRRPDRLLRDDELARVARGHGSLAVRPDLHRRPGRLGRVLLGAPPAGGPITFVERQLAHVWAPGVVAINLIFVTEWLSACPC